MKGSLCTAAFLGFLLLFSTLTSARHTRRLRSRHAHRHPTPGVDPEEANYMKRSEMKQLREDTLQVAGSRLPDCSHACGSCTPCRLVMVSFVCASLAEAETCPIAYKCMCKNKSYPVP